MPADRTLSSLSPDLRIVLAQAGRLARLAADSALPPTGVVEVWAPALTVPPPRWNFAGYCYHCARHGCRSRHCATEWRRAAWAVCTTCGGRGHDEPSASPCACVGGLMEIVCD